MGTPRYRWTCIRFCRFWVKDPRWIRCRGSDARGAFAKPIPRWGIVYELMAEAGLLLNRGRLAQALMTARHGNEGRVSDIDAALVAAEVN